MKGSYHAGLQFRPVMALEVEVSPPGEPERIERLWAIIDTGSDLCAIPRRLIGLFDLQAADELPIADATGDVKRQFLYDAVVTIPTLGSFAIRANGTSQPFAILGLDILNRFVLTGHGPEGWFELENPGATGTG